MIPFLLCPLCHGTPVAELDDGTSGCNACGYTWTTTPALEWEVRADFLADREARERRERRRWRTHRWLRRQAEREHLERAFAEGGQS